MNRNNVTTPRSRGSHLFEPDPITFGVRRQSAVRKSAGARRAEHAEYQRRMKDVGEGRDGLVSAVTAWGPYAREQDVATVLGWYALSQGLSFDEALARVKEWGKHFWFITCRDFKSRGADRRLIVGEGRSAVGPGVRERLGLAA